MTHANRLKPLTQALADHSSEGIAILTAEPARALSAVVLRDDRRWCCARWPGRSSARPM